MYRNAFHAAVQSLIVACICAAYVSVFYPLAVIGL